MPPPKWVKSTTTATDGEVHPAARAAVAAR
jgi:hypothetical protein